MRISKIKLAGFKSFVDPMALSLRGNLTGIVGPNGCGKSNIIDALLWVMGESSAKHLRGDSMADVIFNGSSARKPVGQAVVEIVFDNKDQGLGGQYAGYGEISIKRQVSRDGASVYYLNGTRCRRRDITDLFLGKGIGSRSYSVIEQGMISRVIEAKPEELRLFLEEAAGISKYKERRQETENRLRHTKENLNRLNDIRNELQQRLVHLDQQAQAAEKYQRLQESKRRTQAELLGLTWRMFQHEFEAQNRHIQQRETALEGGLARLREIELSIEKVRSAQSAATEQINQVQAAYYNLGAEVSRLEQGIQHAKERRGALERDLEQACRDLKEAEAHVLQNEYTLTELAAAIEKTTPEHERLMASEQDAYERLVQSEQALQAWQTEWDRFNQQTSESFREEKGEITRIEHLEANLTELRQRLEVLRRESEGLMPEDLEEAISDLSHRIGEAETAYQQLQVARTEKQDQLKKAREEVESLSQALDQARHAHQVLSGRLASLKALQQSAQASDQVSVRKWLEERGFAGSPRLSQQITVQEGWETAAETVLGFFLHALHVPCLDGIAQDLSSFQRGALAFFDSQGGKDRPSQPPGRAGFVRLSEKITSPWPMDGLLNGVYSVDTLAEALHLRTQLQPYESVITQDGNWLGAHWLRVIRDQDEKTGILLREREIKELDGQRQELETRVAEYAERLEKARGALRYLEREQDESQTRLIAAQELLGGLRSELAAKETKLSQLRSRKERIETDIQDLENQESHDAAELGSARARLESIRREVSSMEMRRSEQLQERDATRASLQSAREDWRLARDRRHELALRLESMRTQTVSLQQALNRSKTLVEQISARTGELRRTLSHLEDPTERMKTELERALRERLAVEDELRAARAESQALDTCLREQEQRRAGCEREIQSMRRELEQARLDTQMARVHLENIEEQLKALGFHYEPLLSELPSGAEKEEWEKRLEAIERKIQRLEPINLAAIDEFAQLSERKDYLDRQHNDLTEALETLENAIRKIDRETRGRFKETFDKVNASLKNLFPALFGGGHAHLELTSEDLLETGVQVIAHPPGKRNSTIHLLSGGEKALTALALVFSFFELNPAPFCLLDEVDAPLDDANVVRLCDMLKGRAEIVQFLFVTHNKTTMEIAENLIGVTMQEAGVSRIVAVDIDEAMAMAATG